MIEYIAYQNNTLAIIVRSTYSKDGIKFFTPNDFSQQLAYMKRPKNYCIQPHTHNSVPRKVNHTQEVLLIKSGEVRVDFYDNNKRYLQSRILNPGDVILFASGGHGLKMLEISEIIEVKQGPYAGDDDKTRFDGILENHIEIKRET
jgi:mannose-6-phosphate isomerase-like protein (cupin superfamily)